MNMVDVLNTVRVQVAYINNDTNAYYKESRHVYVICLNVHLYYISIHVLNVLYIYNVLVNVRVHKKMQLL